MLQWSLCLRVITFASFLCGISFGSIYDGQMRRGRKCSKMHCASHWNFINLALVCTCYLMAASFLDPQLVGVWSPEYNSGDFWKSGFQKKKKIPSIFQFWIPFPVLSWFWYLPSAASCYLVMLDLKYCYWMICNEWFAIPCNVISQFLLHVVRNF